MRQFNKWTMYNIALLIVSNLKAHCLYIWHTIIYRFSTNVCSTVTLLSKLAIILYRETFKIVFWITPCIKTFTRFTSSIEGFSINNCFKTVILIYFFFKEISCAQQTVLGWIGLSGTGKVNIKSFISNNTYVIKQY